MPRGLVSVSSEAPAEYGALVTQLRQVFLAGQQQIEAVRIRSYWESGRLIHGHILKNQKRANYGKQVIPKLAESLGLSERLLYRIAQFFEVFPILPARAELTWTHYSALSQVPGDKERRELESQAAQNNWSARDLEEKIRELAFESARKKSESSPESAVRLLTPKRGKIGVFRIVKLDRLAVDFGFAKYLAAPAAQLGELNEGGFVTIGAKERIRPAKGPSNAADLFTYRAECLRIVDGDTFWARVWLTDDLFVKEKLRLRGLDAPEIDTPEGKSAKRAVEGRFQNAAGLVVSTTKPDKWDRYLADVFLKQPDGTELYLNNFLLSEGHARRMDCVKFADWGDE